MTAFYSVSEFSPKSVLLQFGTSRARLKKRLTHSAQKIREHFSYFQNFQKMEPGFQIFHIPVPKMCFGACGRSGMCKKSRNYFPL